MVCRITRDKHGVSYHIPEAPAVQSPKGHVFPGAAAVDVWWARLFKEKQDELLLIRQEDGEQVDVITLTLGQVYDMIQALGWSVMRP